METYNLKFITPYTICSNFKEKDINYINAIISGSRLGTKIYFSTMANIYFKDDDKYHFNPICNVPDMSIKGKFNCMVFNIDYYLNEHEKFNDYDKIFVYQVDYRNTDNRGYSYVLYNSETGKSSHIPTLASIVDELIIKINSSLDNQKKYRLLEELLKKSIHKSKKYES